MLPTVAKDKTAARDEAGLEPQLPVLSITWTEVVRAMPKPDTRTVYEDAKGASRMLSRVVHGLAARGRNKQHHHVHPPTEQKGKRAHQTNREETREREREKRDDNAMLDRQEREER